MKTFESLKMNFFVNLNYRRCEKLTKVMVFSDRYIGFQKGFYFEKLSDFGLINHWLQRTIKKIALYSPIERQISFWRLKVNKRKLMKQSVENKVILKKMFQNIEKTFNIEKLGAFVRIKAKEKPSIFNLMGNSYK